MGRGRRATTPDRVTAERDDRVALSLQPGDVAGAAADHARLVELGFQFPKD